MPSDELSSNDSAVIDDDLVQALGFEPSVDDDVAEGGETAVAEGAQVLTDGRDGAAAAMTGVVDNVDVDADLAVDAADDVELDSALSRVIPQGAEDDGAISDLATELGFEPVGDAGVVDLDADLDADLDELGFDADLAVDDPALDDLDAPGLDVADLESVSLESPVDDEAAFGATDLDSTDLAVDDLDVPDLDAADNAAPEIDTGKAAKGFGLASFFTDRRGRKDTSGDADTDLALDLTDEESVVDVESADPDLDDVASAFADDEADELDVAVDESFEPSDEAEVDVPVEADAGLDVVEADADFDVVEADADFDVVEADAGLDAVDDLVDVDSPELDADAVFDVDAEPGLDAAPEFDAGVDVDGAELLDEFDVDGSDLESPLDVALDSDLDGLDSDLDGLDIEGPDLDIDPPDAAAPDLDLPDLDASIDGEGPELFDHALDADDTEASALIDLTSDVDRDAPTGLIDPIDLPDLDDDLDSEVPELQPVEADADLDDGAVVAAPGAVRRRRPRRHKQVRARKARRVVRHVDPWSVLTFSVLFHLAFFAAMLLASVLVWNAALASGTLENIENFITDLGDYESFEINGDVVFRSAVIIAGMLTLASSVMVVLLTVVFNLISDLIGGIRITVIEEETVRVPNKTSRR